MTYEMRQTYYNHYTKICPTIAWWYYYLEIFVSSNTTVLQL